MTNAEIISHLIKAREKLAQGWCQEFLHWIYDDGRQAWCLIGAIREVAEKGDFRKTFDALRKTAAIDKSMWWPLPQDLIAWNDAPGRTQQDVLDLVDRAIASLMKMEAAEIAEPREELVEA